MEHPTTLSRLMMLKHPPLSPSSVALAGLMVRSAGSRPRRTDLRGPPPPPPSSTTDRTRLHGAGPARATRRSATMRTRL